MPADLLKSYGEVAGATALATVLLTKSVTSAVSYFLGDMVSQLFEGRRRAVLLDLPRMGRNAALGFALHGPLLHFWIETMEGPIATLAGGNDEPAAICLKIVLDQTVFTTTINLVYAFLDGLLAEQTPSEAFERARQVLSIPTC